MCFGPFWANADAAVDTRWAALRVFLHLQLTRQIGRHVDLGGEPLVGQQLRHAVQSLHSERVVGVWEKIDHRHRPLRQANLLRDESDARATWLTLPRHTPLARHAVGQVGPSTRVRRSSPLQDQCRLLQGADQVSGWRRGPWRDVREIIFIGSAATDSNMSRQNPFTSFLNNNRRKYYTFMGKIQSWHQNSLK